MISLCLSYCSKAIVMPSRDPDVNMYKCDGIALMFNNIIFCGLLERSLLDLSNSGKFKRQTASEIAI